RDRLEDDVKRAFDRVPEAYGTSLFLSAVRELSCKEIAHELGVPPGTVMSRVHRAREHMKTELSSRRRAFAQPCQAKSSARRRDRRGNQGLADRPTELSEQADRAGRLEPAAVRSGGAPRRTQAMNKHIRL